MRKREEILKDYIGSGAGSVFQSTKDQGNMRNPKLQLEVSLDIRDLLKELLDSNKK